MNDNIEHKLSSICDLISGIGIDDSFVMLAAWRRTSVKLDVPERMGLMMSEAAVSITITSLTDIVSFMIGVYCTFPSVQIFCAYSGLAVMFIFVWHITFFAACVALSGYCEQKNLHSVLGYKVTPLSVAIKGKLHLSMPSAHFFDVFISRSSRFVDSIAQVDFSSLWCYYYIFVYYMI